MLIFALITALLLSLLVLVLIVTAPKTRTKTSKQIFKTTKIGMLLIKALPIELGIVKTTGSCLCPRLIKSFRMIQLEIVFSFFLFIAYRVISDINTLQFCFSIGFFADISDATGDITPLLF